MHVKTANGWAEHKMHEKYMQTLKHQAKQKNKKKIKPASVDRTLCGDVWWAVFHNAYQTKSQLIMNLIE